MRILGDVIRELQRIARGATHEHWKLRRRIAAVLAATLTVDVIGTTLMYALEHDKEHSQITSVFTGFFWVTTQLLTVSSQMANPVTTGGRIVDIALELCALTVVTALAGSFAAFLLKK